MAKHPIFSWQTSGGPSYLYLKIKSKEMRKNPTEAERIMWEILRKNSFGLKFRRQHIIGNYIVDFINLDTKLVIEIDGGYHQEENQIEYDEFRTEFLNKKDFNVIRFSNDQVLKDYDSVITRIQIALNNLL